MALRPGQLFLGGLLLVGCAVVERAHSPVAPGVSAEASETPVHSEADELEAIMRTDEQLASFVDDAAKRRVQVLVSIPRPEGGLRRLRFRVDAEYFYPASAVKLCAAVAALEKLDDIRRLPGGSAFGLDSRLRIIEGEGRMRHVLVTTLRNELERSLVISDNDSHNRLFDFVGPGELAARLADVGILSARIGQHLGREGPERPPPVMDFLGQRRVLRVPQRTDLELPPAPAETLVGASHVDRGGTIVAAPMDFSQRNIISLQDLHYLLIAVTRPHLADRGKQALHNEEDRKRLLHILGMLPSDLGTKLRRFVPQRTNAESKPMHVAIVGAVPSERVRVFGKGGRAYGFSVESVYALDEETGRFFFVTTTIYANDNDTLNDDRYEYDAVTSPFMARLGRVLAEKFLVDPAPSGGEARRMREE